MAQSANPDWTSSDALEDLQRNSDYWIDKARALRASAFVLWSACQRGQIGGDGKSSVVEKGEGLNTHGMWQVYRMLCGMSLELAYKASLVAFKRRPAHTHNLVALAEEVMPRLSPHHRRLLALLSECVVWEGRYPCPKDGRTLEYYWWLHFEALFTKVRVGNSTTLEPKAPDPLAWESFNALWEAAVSAFEAHRAFMD